MANHFEFNIRVYIEDTDAGGIVYHANHIRYMERTRTEWLRAAGVSHYWHQTDYNFVVHKINVKYMRPILMDDLITVTARVISCKASSFVLQQNIYRGEIMLASGEVELACISAEMRPRRLPDEIRELIQKNWNKTKKFIGTRNNYGDSVRIISSSFRSYFTSKPCRTTGDAFSLVSLNI